MIFIGSCCSILFANNISNYLSHMLDLVDMVTKPGSLTYEVCVIRTDVVIIIIHIVYLVYSTLCW
jgi:hypothetical protein